jgi:hypothetical protein
MPGRPLGQILGISGPSPPRWCLSTDLPIDFFEQIAKLLSNLVWWISCQRRGDQTLRLSHVTGVQPEGCGAPKQNGPSGLELDRVLHFSRSRALLFERQGEQLSRTSYVTELLSFIGVVSEGHRSAVEVRDGTHSDTIRALGVPNSTTTTSAGMIVPGMLGTLWSVWQRSFADRSRPTESTSPPPP